MRIDIVTVFPEMVAPVLDHSIVKRARERGLVTINVVNLRDFTIDRHRTTDDIPYGGGGGMVMKIEPIARALDALMHPAQAAPASSGNTEPHAPAPVAVTTENEPVPIGVPSEGGDAANVSADADVSEWERADSGQSWGIVQSSGIMKRPRIVLTDPRGTRFSQETARLWAREPHLILLCGHYEGVDERVRRHLVTDEVSIGDYILTGGELPALIVVDALTRLQPGALGDEQAPEKDSFAEDLLEYPHYTRPREFNGWTVPDILLCGHHAQIERWRRWHQLQDTRERRPDLFARFKLARDDVALLAASEPVAPSDPKATAKAAREARRIFDLTTRDGIAQGPAAIAPAGNNAALDNEEKNTMRDHAGDNTALDNEKHEVTDGSGTGNHT